MVNLFLIQIGFIGATVAPRVCNRRIATSARPARRIGVILRFAVGALRDVFDARNRNRRNNPVERDEFHAFFLDELPVITAFKATPDFVGELAAPGPEFNAENNHGNIYKSAHLILNVKWAGLVNN